MSRPQSWPWICFSSASQQHFKRTPSFEMLHLMSLKTVESMYDRVSDVVENGVSFASKILTHHRMH